VRARARAAEWREALDEDYVRRFEERLGEALELGTTS
jgi:hypothetical protein